MEFEILKKIGLSDEEASVYGYLLENGERTAGAILKKLPIKRGQLYNILKSLVYQGLVEQYLKNGVAHFRLEHPNKLSDLLKKEDEDIDQTKSALEDILPAMISQYNLTHHKPAVRYFEGLEGVQKVLEDSLTSNTEIYSYGDLDSINKYIPDINKEYVKKREKMNIKKKGFAFDSPAAREFLKNYFPSVTETRLIDYDAPLTHTILQIYDNKISYVTLSDKALIGVIIEDANIYSLHKYLFEYMWSIKTS